MGKVDRMTNMIMSPAESHTIWRWRRSDFLNARQLPDRGERHRHLTASSPARYIETEPRQFGIQNLSGR